MDPIQQSPNLPPVPQSNSPSFPKTTLALTGVIVLLLILLGGSFYQILSLKKQIDKLETAAKSESTPVATPVSTGTSTVTVAPAPTGGTNEPIEIVGTIQKSDVEGGCWYIQPEEPKCEGGMCPLGQQASYEPLNLPKELQKTGLKAKFKLEVQSGVATTCQIGPAVKILDYQIIK